MKVKFLSIIFLVTLILLVTPVFAVKPTNNLAGAQEIAWNLSADVMPVPPYGSVDIPGSDEASKLVMNQPNGAVEVALTGVMKGLNPNTQYTVFLSNSYTAYEYTGWSIAGSWTMRADYLGSNYDHDYIFTQAEDGTITGTGGYPAGELYTHTETITGNINPLTGEITLHSVYLTGNPGYVYDVIAQIQPDGSIEGTWGNVGQGYGHAWDSISGIATETHTGDDYWTGLFTGTIPAFTFMTDEYGSGSWHLNLKDVNFDGAGTYSMSVWINDGGTLLISDNFNVVVD